MNPQPCAQTTQTASPPTHIATTFQFILRAPLSRAAPLFGAEGERCWAGEDWNPRFLYPQPARDLAGAVFTVERGSRHSVWVNTVFDLAAGRMQYVSFTPGKVVSLIDVQLTSLTPARTRVEVTYARTALNVDANAEVEAMGKLDAAHGPHWRRSIEACLQSRKE